MTGEISLRGNVLPIGGLKQKVLGARRAGIKRILLPFQNEPDLEEVPEEVRKSMKFVMVRTIDEVLEHALRPARPRPRKKSAKAKTKTTLHPAARATSSAPRSGQKRAARGKLRTRG